MQEMIHKNNHESCDCLVIKANTDFFGFWFSDMHRFWAFNFHEQKQSNQSNP